VNPATKTERVIAALETLRQPRPPNLECQRELTCHLIVFADPCVFVGGKQRGLRTRVRFASTGVDGSGRGVEL
jgi:hypothetical protein